MVKRETSNEIDDAAALWAARVDLSPLTEDQQRELDAWLAGDPRRLGAYGKARAVLVHTDRASALGSDYDPEQFHSAPPISRRRVLMIGGGTIAASAVGAVSVSLLTSSPTYATALGEVRLVPLDDGSVVTLNTASRISIAYSTNERRVMLLEGEALFEVAKDPKRPFFVEAGDTQVRAIGTAFTVRRTDAARVEVTVREGVVETIQRPKPGKLSQGVTRLTANMKLTEDTALPKAVPIVLPPDDVARSLAWREGKIAFNGVTLQVAVAEFARYSGTPIILDGSAVAKQRVTGLFSATNPEGFARSVATVLDLKAETTPEGIKLSETAS